MSFSLKTQSNPFQFLLYTEWLMLASCGLFAIVEAFGERRLPVQHLLILTLLGLMGSMLPTSGKFLHRLLYTGIEVSLIFYGATLGYLHILPTLYLIVAIRSCFLFDQQSCWVVAGLTFVLFLVHQVQYVQNIALLVPSGEQQQFWMHLIAETLMFGLGLFLVLKLVNTLLAERQAQQQLSSAHEQLRQYALQIEDLAAVQERNRIARDIHDSLGHVLTALNVQMQTTATFWQSDLEQAKLFFIQAQRLGEQAIKEVRQSVRALRVDARQAEPLEAAVHSLVEDFHQGTGIPVFVSIGIDTFLPPQVVKTLYRIVQEALTNIRKHAQATEIQIQISAISDCASLAVKDNGRGFSLHQEKTGFGLQGMQERVAALSGQCQIESKPGSGCCITIELPLRESSRALLLDQQAHTEQSHLTHNSPPSWKNAIANQGFVR